MISGNQYSISYVSKRTGLSPHVIRAWERRHNAITPSRTGKNRRMYSDSDLQRLLLLRQATDSGHRIGQLARMSTERLLDLNTAEQKFQHPVSLKSYSVSSGSDPHLSACMEAVLALDSARLEHELIQASVDSNRGKFLQEVVSPLMRRIGELWSEGHARIVEEHMASVVVRNLLSSLTNPAPSESNPGIVFATPVGQMHEFGALTASIHAASLGWRVYYLGPNLPAEEIASAVQRKKAKAVGLSILYKGEELTLFQELQRLRSAIGNDVTVLVGGSAATLYRDILEQISAIQVFDFQQFQLELSKLR